MKTPTERAAAAASARQRRQRRAAGLPSSSFIDAGPALAHVGVLRGQGMSIKGIAAAAGVSHMTIHRMLYSLDGYPPSRRILDQSAAAILAVQATPALMGLIPAIGVQRRLRALVAMGWSIERVAQEMGWYRRNFHYLIHHNEVVEPATYRAARKVYGVLLGQIPPGLRAGATKQQKAAVTRARNTAAQHGWLPPAAWDDDAIDDPNAQPDLPALRGERRHPPRRKAPIATVMVLRERDGLSFAEIGHRLGFQASTIKNRYYEEVVRRRERAAQEDAA